MSFCRWYGVAWNKKEKEIEEFNFRYSSFGDPSKAAKFIEEDDDDVMVLQCGSGYNKNLYSGPQFFIGEEEE